MDNAPLPQPKPDQVKPHPRRARGRLWRKAVKRTPTILQMEAVECGAAALAMVFAHHGANRGVRETGEKNPGIAAAAARIARLETGGRAAGGPELRAYRAQYRSRGIFKNLRR